MVARINEVNSKKSGQPSNVLKTREKDWNCHFCEALGSRTRTKAVGDRFLLNKRKKKSMNHLQAGQIWR